MSILFLIDQSVVSNADAVVCEQGTGRKRDLARGARRRLSFAKIVTFLRGVVSDPLGQVT
jgi:hypothetical protein